jgi:hypothetical protein
MNSSLLLYVAWWELLSKSFPQGLALTVNIKKDVRKIKKKVVLKK